MGTLVRLGDLLIRAKQVTEKDVERALEQSKETGGRLGETLVAIGAIDEPTLSSFINRIPTEPADIAATGMDESELVDLLLKLIYVEGLENVRQFIDAIKLPFHIVGDVVKLAVDRALLQTLGSRRSDNPLDMSYALTEGGRAWSKNALERSGYCGPAPVTLAEYCDQVILQKPTNEVITMARVREAVTGLEIEDAMLEQVGPALNSGRAILMYGPPGNGKTTVALRFGAAFHDVIYVPYAVVVEGQIIRLFDPSIHTEVAPAGLSDDGETFVRQNDVDLRWLPCRRPFVTVGGELTLEMLDLRYYESARYYEAPLHMKALGGVFFIDDFGRQLVSPTHLLNRWIVPLEARYDFLKLHTGKTMRIPFEELVIFSTNLDPEDLMDPAFLRRLPYKIEVGGPGMERYLRIFQQECERNGLTLTEEVFTYTIAKLQREKGMDLAAYQPRFIVDQVVATCRFMEQQQHFEARYIDYALDNLRVRRPGEDPQRTQTTASAGEPTPGHRPAAAPAAAKHPAQQAAPEPAHASGAELLLEPEPAPEPLHKPAPASSAAKEAAQQAAPEPTHASGTEQMLEPEPKPEQQYKPAEAPREAISPAPKPRTGPETLGRGRG